MRPCPDEIRTERLLLRRWDPRDTASYAALQSNAHVRRFFLKALTAEESEVDAKSHEESFEHNGFGLWVIEIPDDTPFIGIAGVRRIGREMPFEPRLEVGWHFSPSFWGRGFALEAARAALRDFFTRTDFQAVVSYTAHLNDPSKRLMQRLGMTTSEAEDFDHPAMPEGHPLRRHVLYRLSRNTFLAAETARSGERLP
ncbi:GNAT family N-acetyltransferase [Microvirga sp. 2MCAF38]|uniref:GNAT family N-acetyltransferase n=1 Tax=Microvirga sp. 2MCAF38 TaxID=3232989 RepID=UPI003F9DCDBE